VASKEAEESVFKAASQGLKRWLGRVREVVMSPFRQFKAQPNPQSIASTVPLWQAQVDRILEALTPALREGWAAAHLPGDLDLMDPYIQANLALTYNLLVRIPDEVHAKIVKEILEGTNAGETVNQIAQRVDRVLDYEGQENWAGRARNIAQTETTRHRNSSALAHGLLVEKNDRRELLKKWDTTMDGRERMAHRISNDQEQPLNQPFIVDGVPMQFPGDPSAPPDLVCGCRCDLEIIKVRN
jgi:Phage Mu protein F like protein